MYGVVVSYLCFGSVFVVHGLCIGCVLILSWLCLGCFSVVCWLHLDCVLSVPSLYLGCVLAMSWLCLGCVLAVSWLCAVAHACAAHLRRLHPLVRSLSDTHMHKNGFKARIRGLGFRVKVWGALDV